MGSWIYIKLKLSKNFLPLHVFREKRQFLTIILFGREGILNVWKYINKKKQKKMLHVLFLMEKHLAFAALSQVFHSKQNMIKNSW